MSVALTELLQYLDRTLQPGQFRDFCPNGLQVEGRARISRLVTGVTASQRLLDAAIEQDADAILVHHGYFWRGEPEPVVGMKRRRLATLLKADVSLLAYHLPLDAHPTLGNNARLGQLLEIEGAHALQPDVASSVGNIGDLRVPVRVDDFAQRLRDLTGRTALHVGDPSGLIQRVAWCTGAAQSYIDAAVAAGADAFVTGEASEQTVHVAREEGIHFFAAGHHATERYGVQALGQDLAEKFKIEHQYIDIENPV